ncbi:hypothetical protein BH11PLA2_BH11PLA2_35450 [soil metagenome]
MSNPEELFPPEKSMEPEWVWEEPTKDDSDCARGARVVAGVASKLKRNRVPLVI